MVDEVKVSTDEPAPVVDASVAQPEVPAVAVAETEQPIAEKPAKPVRAPKVRAKAVPVETPAPVEAVVPAPAKPVKAPKPPKKAAVSTQAIPTEAIPVKAKARAPKLPAKAAAPAPAVKPASKRPFTVKPRVKTAFVKTPSVKTFVGTAKAPTSRKELFAMATTTTTEFTDKLQTAFKDAQEKAKAAFGDAGSFAKGNVEAIVESSKILATGLQDMTKGYVAETKTSFETMTADVKDLAAVKSPTEFFEKQSALLRKNFDAAVAASSKNSEAMLKLVNEAFQPISTRVSLAVEKIKQAA